MAQKNICGMNVNNASNIQLAVAGENSSFDQLEHQTVNLFSTLSLYSSWNCLLFFSSCFCLPSGLCLYVTCFEKCVGSTCRRPTQCLPTAQTWPMCRLQMNSPSKHWLTNHSFPIEAARFRIWFGDSLVVQRWRIRRLMRETQVQSLKSKDLTRCTAT